MFNLLLKSTTSFTGRVVRYSGRNSHVSQTLNSCNIAMLGQRSYASFVDEFLKNLKEKELNNINNNNNNKKESNNILNNKEININNNNQKDILNNNVERDLDFLNSLNFGNNNNSNNNNNNNIDNNDSSNSSNDNKDSSSSFNIRKVTQTTKEAMLARHNELKKKFEFEEIDDDEDDDFIDKHEHTSGEANNKSRKVNLNNNNNNTTTTNNTNNTKKSRKHRQHVNPLSYRLQMTLDPPKWEEIFADLTLPIHIDLGCGKGDMLVKSAILKPDYNYLGIDIRDHCIEMANSSKSLLEFELNTQIKNLHFVETNVSVNLFNVAKSLPTNSIQKLSLLFPDPWHKRKHIKRRIVNANFVREVAMILPPGAKVYLMSDVYELYDEMLNHFISNSSFESIDFSKNEWDIEVTARQNYYIEKDIPYWRAVLVRTEKNESTVKTIL
ncbi:tRNA (guanine-N(7))-methyltransferase [Heterostelium album PN500]|uniref:tRNA (guanine(46)-N(7))-methyltransferase n=1 Tax=Heterostelium pallidum (strain ATCC 26659 / Pp 5 / PN500) TaxID=670386 RepID=D3BA47_HETP5|nr:tRNA (guanine-N(7))-methyltransferase [Heterostelium album PN500]EFA81434.1 tRNA (guanine-N(7))-methyltransferase [Heterostelium album PN500]|eukprot:XP_020433552.1 tRNA (guanine-N(7))-methyltransferase [Heterostelium album PN500]